MPALEKTSNEAIAHVWCDVGGTFTDCFVVTCDGDVRRTKVLSHGRVPGRVARWINKDRFCDPLRRTDPAEFWNGCSMRWVDRNGMTLGISQCIHFDAINATLTFQSVPNATFDPTANAGVDGYELCPELEAPILAARLLLEIPLRESLPNIEMRLGTTRATNALLTRTGARTAFVTTAGFADLLAIAYQERPELFAIHVVKREPLYESVVEIRERLNAQGEVLQAIDSADARIQLQQLYDQGVRSLAICLLHSWCNPVHEQLIARIAGEIGFECIRISSEVAPVIKAVSRGETAVVDAYLTPIVQEYLCQVQNQLSSNASSPLRIMTSSGGLVSSSEASGRELVLSGPAGGAVALQSISNRFGAPKLIGLDMGGTSTDVCRIDGRLQIEHESIKAGVRMMVSTLAIQTVAAGGGSVCWFDGVQLRVGPQSAGSNPGPACYGRGGPLTLTDLNLLQGRIDPSRFPIPLTPEASLQRVEELHSQIVQVPIFKSMEVEGLIAGLRRIANEQMASAVRAISIEQGADPREHALAGFGGAAGQHICEIAELLGMDRIVDHPDAGLLSALGIGLARIQRRKNSPIYRNLNRIKFNELIAAHESLRDEIAGELNREGLAESQMNWWSEVELRYVGTQGTLLIPWKEPDKDSLATWTAWSAAFESAHQQRFGYTRSGHPLELVSLWIEGSSAGRNLEDIPTANAETYSQNPFDHRSVEESRMVSNQRWHTIEKLDRSACKPGSTIPGPALIQSNGSTTIIDLGWQASVELDGTLILSKKSQSLETQNRLIAPTQQTELNPDHGEAEIDPVLREVLAQRIAAIADQMGIVLEQTAISVNVKQRRDFSCAVFDANGELIANAPHVPVHLGAMSRTVKGMILEFPAMKPGDCYVTNDPYRGGSHLPDVTVVSPVFAADADFSKPDFFVASRAHHAEIGGIAPGSMAPTSTRLGEEGVILPPMRLLDGGIDRSQDVDRMLRTATYPSRNVSENMADLAAQQAANMRGAVAMKELADQIGCDRLQRYLESILSAAETKTRLWIQSLENREYRWSDSMDDGTVIAVSIRKEHDGLRERLRIDFEGTGAESRGNLNANPGIVTAAVLYVVRCAIADTMPLNSGVLRAIELDIPPGILNPRTSGPIEDWPAVAGGNVETSQRVVDCLLGALELAAASQGTMNNFLFGNSTFGYYETIGGGTGGSPLGPGADAVHSHMTNTRLTDVEVLESRYPVRVMEFSIRRGSGGIGAHRGGDGMIRELIALQ
ncbi:MAG: hypothetical protein FJ308_14585, partial [Planctomycetes bacterium]|nr:hypothetical protein [Planctomycetota bacterium]